MNFSLREPKVSFLGCQEVEGKRLSFAFSPRISPATSFAPSQKVIQTTTSVWGHKQDIGLLI